MGHPAIVGVLHDLAQPADHLEPALGQQAVVMIGEPVIKPPSGRVEIEHEGRPALIVLADVGRADHPRVG